MALSKNELTVHIVYSVQADKLYTFENFNEMLLTMLFIKAEPKTKKAAKK
jgi:hypothetical protein